MYTYEYIYTYIIHTHGTSSDAQTSDATLSRSAALARLAAGVPAAFASLAYAVSVRTERVLPSPLPILAIQFGSQFSAWYFLYFILYSLFYSSIPRLARLARARTNGARVRVRPALINSSLGALLSLVSGISASTITPPAEKKILAQFSLSTSISARRHLLPIYLPPSLGTLARESKGKGRIPPAPLMLLDHSKGERTTRDGAESGVMWGRG